MGLPFMGAIIHAQARTGEPRASPYHGGERVNRLLRSQTRNTAGCAGLHARAPGKAAQQVISQACRHKAGRIAVVARMAP